MEKKITLSEVQKKDLKIVGYLVVSGLLGIGLSWVMQKPELTVVVTPAINYILFRIEKELTDQGYRAALKR